jgi:hypothetical protein
VLNNRLNASRHFKIFPDCKLLLDEIPMKIIKPIEPETMLVSYMQDIQLTDIELNKLQELEWNKNPPVSDEIGIIDYETYKYITDFHNAFNFGTREVAAAWIESQRTV